MTDLNHMIRLPQNEALSSNNVGWQDGVASHKETTSHKEATSHKEPASHKEAALVITVTDLTAEEEGL